MPSFGIQDQNMQVHLCWFQDTLEYHLWIFLCKVIFSKTTLKKYSSSNYDNYNWCIMFSKKVCIFTKGKMDCNSKKANILISIWIFKVLKQWKGAYRQMTFELQDFNLWLVFVLQMEHAYNGNSRNVKKMTLGLL